MPFVKYHLPCPKCLGSDPVSLNDDGSAWCFSCSTYFKNYENSEEGNTVTEISTFKRNTMNQVTDGTFKKLEDRNISLDTAKKYGVKSDDNHYYPYYIKNEMVATKVRNCKTKEFTWRGSPQGVGLFGQQLFKEGGKYITLVEGECDAMAAYELLGSKWPVVSIRNGAGGAVKDVRASIEFLESFDNIIINFDNDKAGEEAATKVARLFKPGKAKILTLPKDFKDPNDLLKSGMFKDYINSWWNAKLYTPSGVINVSDSLDEYHNREEKEAIPYPWEGLNDKLDGLRQGELVTFTGGTGLGKSSITRELEHWIINNTKDNVGIIALEENWHRTVDGIISIEANARLYRKKVREQYTKEQIDEFLHKVYKGKNEGRVWIHAHFGANDVEDLFSKLRYIIVGCNCKWVVVDHLQMIVSSLENGDERRAIDNIMTRLRSLVEETGAGLILVSHLRKIDGNRGHENGIEVNLSHLRGSNSIAQISDCVVALERNQQSDDPIESNTTHLRILKSRYTGDVGMATHLIYDNDTGRLSEVQDYQDLANSDDGDII
jgi:twinkle protein